MESAKQNPILTVPAFPLHSPAAVSALKANLCSIGTGVAGALVTCIAFYIVGLMVSTDNYACNTTQSPSNWPCIGYPSYGLYRYGY